MSPAAPPDRTRMIVAASIGNAIEFYDFIVYGFFAPAIAATFFPGGDATTRLLLTFGAFGVSFGARPIGALVLGAYADRVGRARAMVLSISLMTVSGAMIALMPGRAEVGLAAPWGILAARLIQGLALGGEFGSATALMIEHSEGAEARAASWQSTSQTVAGLLASGVAWLLSGTEVVPVLHVEAFRLAFGLGVLAGPLALLLRRRLHDAPGFLATRHHRAAVDRATLSGIAIAAGMVAIGTAQTYLVVYLPTYATTQLHMRAGSVLGAVFLLYVAGVALTPVRLLVAARFDASRRCLPMVVSCLAVLAAGYPCFILLGLWPNALTLFLLPFGLSLLGLVYNAPLPGFMGMVFPVHRRGVGLSVGYAVGIALFGGFAPFINTWLIARTGDPNSPGLYLVFTAIVSIAAILAASRRLRPAPAVVRPDTGQARPGPPVCEPQRERTPEVRPVRSADRISTGTPARGSGAGRGEA